MTNSITVKAKDTAGGTQLGGTQDFFRVDGQPAVVQGDPVAGHGGAPHDQPVMSESSSFFRVNGIGVCREGDQASCGHPATGRPFFRTD